MMSTKHEDIIKSWAKELVQTPKVAIVAPLPVSPNDKAAKIVEDSLNGMKEILKTSLQRNSYTYFLLGGINIAMVIIGLAFLGFSILYSFQNKTIDQITLSSAGLGAADFAAIFFINPQERIRKSLTNFIQVGIICHSWSNRTQASFMLFLTSQKLKEDVQLFQKTIDEIADDAVQAIEESVEK